MDNDKQPGISFEGILLSKENFSRIPNFSDENVRIDIQLNVILNKNKQTYSAELNTSLKCFSNDDQKQLLNLEFTFVGLFSVKDGEENMDIQDFLNNNAPAIMFPYIREHISEITQKAGVKPILLPPINIEALIKNKKMNF